MRYNPDGHRRRSIRLRRFDYSLPGCYFITTCTANRLPLFDERELRNAVESAWSWLPTRFSNVELDDFIVMPDHVHFVIALSAQGRP